MAVDPVRHQSEFDPYKFGDRRVDVVGCGATGSRIAMLLADLGVQNLHLWDFDTVAPENIGNQRYGLSHVGESKADVLARLIKEKTDIDAVIHTERAGPSSVFGSVVFVLTDTMASRSELWHNALKFKMPVEWLIETRMGVDSGMIYAVHPSRPGHIKAYEETLYPDEESSESACGTKTSVGPTAEVISGLAVWQMIRWFSVEQGGDDELENELIVSVRPTLITSRAF